MLANLSTNQFVFLILMVVVFLWFVVEILIQGITKNAIVKRSSGIRSWIAGPLFLVFLFVEIMVSISP